MRDEQILYAEYSGDWGATDGTDFAPKSVVQMVMLCQAIFTIFKRESEKLRGESQRLETAKASAMLPRFLALSTRCYSHSTTIPTGPTFQIVRFLEILVPI